MPGPARLAGRIELKLSGRKDSVQKLATGPEETQNPSANLASSVIISGDQGGSKIIFG